MKMKSDSVKREYTGQGLDSENCVSGYNKIGSAKVAPPGNDGEYVYMPKDAKKNTVDDKPPSSDIGNKK
jgi:hypothetical protein